jgi:magnesium transporter
MAMHEQDDQIVDALLYRFFAEQPKVAAQELAKLDSEEAAQILSELPIESMIPAWEALSADTGAQVLVHFSPEKRSQLASLANIGMLAVLLSRMDEEDRQSILASLPEEVAAELRALMSYPPNTAGQLMDTRIIGFKADQTVAEALETLRQRRQNRSVSELRIVDDEKRLKALVNIKDLALAEPQQTLESLAHGVPAVVLPLDPREDVVDKLQQFSLDELPVVDNNGVLLGVIRHSELIGALQEAATLDMQTMVGVSKDERATSTSWFAVRKRMPWLQVNLLTAFLAAAVVGLFEGTIAKVTALAVLLPVVAGQSGNAGAQALAVTMRGLALREIRIANWLGVMRKEMNAGFWNGISIAVTCAAGVYVWSGSVGLVIVIAVSMVISMVMAGIAGALVPITLAKLGQDPAVASSIVLTTVTDIAGFFSFLGIATLLMSTLT